MLKAINLGVAFLLELAMLVMFGTWGFQASTETIFRVGLGIGTPLLAIIIWSIFLAPRSERRLKGISYLVLKSLLFGVAAIAFVAAGQGTLALIFVVVAIINQGLLLAWKQETLQTEPAA
jgi:hypothetical protein